MKKIFISLTRWAKARLYLFVNFNTSLKAGVMKPGLHSGFSHANFFIFLFFVLHVTKSFSQNVEVYPSSWWVGMKWNKVQLMLYYPHIGQANLFSYSSKEFRIVNNKTVENKNYLF